MSFVEPDVVRTQQGKATHPMKNNPRNVEPLSSFGCPGQAPV
uniref:Uncharacterized protein n=1 Tax=Rhizophora mucronata TaxID=61149 RepID=A0A2P2QRM4_RHIMU